MWLQAESSQAISYYVWQLLITDYYLKSVYTINTPPKNIGRSKQTSYFDSLTSEPVTSEARTVSCFQKEEESNRNKKYVIYTNLGWKWGLYLISVYFMALYYTSFVSFWAVQFSSGRLRASHWYMIVVADWRTYQNTDYALASPRAD